MLCADRTVAGPYENYITPEQCVPDQPLGVPWESCITLGTSFSFAYEDTYKKPREVILLLIDIVAKGGNLAINVGPQPDGRLPAGAVESLKGMGRWLKIYGDAIYGTRVCAPYKKGNIAFTQKDGKVYALGTVPGGKFAGSGGGFSSMGRGSKEGESSGLWERGSFYRRGRRHPCKNASLRGRDGADSKSIRTA